MIDKWRIEENVFSEKTSGKHEALMTLGNGYMGIRAGFEEEYAGQSRGFFIAGTYNRAGLNEVAELPNVADITAFEIIIDNERFSLLKGKIHEYNFTLDMKTGELKRELVWENTGNKKFKMIFRRFVSLENRHLVCSKVSIEALDEDSNVKIKTGVDGRQTNSGVQHFHEMEKRVYDDKFIQYVQRTTESNIDMYLNTFLHINPVLEKSFTIERRKLLAEITGVIRKKEILEIEKISLVYTSIDKEFINKDINIGEYSLDKIRELKDSRYNELFHSSSESWNNFWEKSEINIESSDEFDNFAVNFSLYHMQIMTPFHDNRFSVGAKGLTGEGYKGHVFWDTEIFMLPFFLYTNPETAKQLLEYRYGNLDEARKKAASKNCRGALFPWESAFDGKEETPEFAAINIKTGKANRVWSAEKEIHIVADIAYAVIEYFHVTGDTEFMKSAGLEILAECSEFWVSRAENDSKTGKYVIKDVIGPDEYTEHIDNNTYTNYMAEYTVSETAKLLESFENKKDKIYLKLAEKLGLEEKIPLFRDFAANIYLPEPDETGIIPQDDTFLSKKIIDISRYADSDSKQGILKDYTRDEVVDMQVLKQADLVMFLYFFKDKFDKDIIRKNWNYYESKTIHDSSLSMAIHAITALYFGEKETAYKCFQKACLIDLGPNPHSSDDGIHAASLGAVWLTCIKGFGGISENGGMLNIEPVLPDNWEKLEFPLVFRKKAFRIKIDKKSVELFSESNDILEIFVNKQKYELKDYLRVLY